MVLRFHYRVISGIQVTKCSIIAFRQCPNLANTRGWRRIHHVHIPKTGGTSANQAIISALGPGHNTESWYSEMFPYPHTIIRNRTVLSAWNTDLMRVVRPHFSFAHTPLHELKRQKTTFLFTVLRDPVRRVVSEFFYHRQLLPRAADFPELAESIVAASESKSVSEWLGHIGTSCNVTTQMFSRLRDPSEAVDAIMSLDCVLMNPISGNIDLAPLVKNFPRLKLTSERIRPSTPRNFVKELGSVGQVREILAHDISVWRAVTGMPTMLDNW